MSQSFTNAAENFETSSVSDFWSLLKPRVMSLVVFSAFCGLVVAPGAIHPVIAFIAILCIAAGAGAAGALCEQRLPGAELHAARECLLGRAILPDALPPRC